MAALWALLLAVLPATLPEGLQEWHALCAEGEWGAASAEALAVFEEDSTSVEAMSAFIVSTYLNDPSGETLSPAKVTIAMDSLSSMAWTAYGAVLMQRGPDLSGQALNALSRAVELDSSIVETRYLTGLLLERDGHPELAVDEYTSAEALDPSFLPVSFQRGRTLWLMGRMDEALEAFQGVEGTGPVAVEALAERVLIADAAGASETADSLALQIQSGDRDVWLDLAAYHSEHDSTLSISALERLVSVTDEASLLSGAASMYLQLGLYGEAATVAGEALESATDSSLALQVLGEARLELGELDEAREVFVTLTAIDPGLAAPHAFLGWISEQEARTGVAVDHYLTALELDPDNGFARERLRVIASDDYDPLMWSTFDAGLNISCSADLSVEKGNREMIQAGGSACIDYIFDGRGSSIDLGFGGRMIEWESTSGLITETKRTETGWASLTGDYWFDDSFFLEASCSWDRQRLTSRPWQVSAYVAGGWQRWLTSWLWVSPELGSGLVSTRWAADAAQDYTDRFTLYGSTGIYFEKPYTFVQQAEITGEVYFPPERPDEFISKGRISLAFRTWEPLYITLAYEVDYTRRPEVSTWRKYDTRFYTSLNFNLL